MFDESLAADKSETNAGVLKDIKDSVDHLYQLKLAADDAEKNYKDAKNELSKLLEDSGVDKMTGDLCTVTLQLKTSCTTPKDNLAKAELFKYIEENYGFTVLQSMLTINSRSFSAWHAIEIEKRIEETGDIEFKLPMVEPYEYYSLGIRKRTIKK